MGQHAAKLRLIQDLEDAFRNGYNSMVFIPACRKSIRSLLVNQRRGKGDKSKAPG